MSRIKDGIEQSMTGHEVTGTAISARFLFPEKFIGFQGHFPDKKVLPGACQVQCVLVAIEKALQHPVILREIVLAKYVVPVFPCEQITCTVSGSAGDVYKARISRGAERVSEIKLKISAGAQP